MTDTTPPHFTISPGGDASGFTGVLPEADPGSRIAAPDRSPMVVGQFHGILTGQSSATWPTFGTGYLGELHPEVRTVNSTYYALPLPRVEALRNRRRSEKLACDIYDAWCELENFADPEWSVPISLVSHSNGGVLALQVARLLIGWGIPVRSLILIAPALRTGPASCEIADWIERGMLESAVLVRPTRDILIGGIGASWRTKLFSWPWGSLGADDWDRDEQHRVHGMTTLDLPDMGHSDPVSPPVRQWLYDTIILPALGLAPWGELQPKGGIEE